MRDIDQMEDYDPRGGSDYANNTLDGTYDGEVNTIKRWLWTASSFMDSVFAQRPECLRRRRIAGYGARSDRSALGQPIELMPPTNPLSSQIPC